jgi:hypothetical protein
MPDKESTNMVAIISASAAILAVVLTQLITAVNNYYSDKRKEVSENRRQRLLKKIDIGENFYHVFRESLLNIIRAQKLFELGISITSKTSEAYLNEMNLQILASANKLIADTSKYNLTEIYYDIESSSEVSAKDVNVLVHLITERIELLNAFNSAMDADKEKIAFQFKEKTEEIIDYYKTVAIRVQNDMVLVKNELQILISTLNAQ